MSENKDNNRKSYSLREFDQVVTARSPRDEAKIKARKDERQGILGCLLMIFYAALFVGFVIMMAAN